MPELMGIIFFAACGICIGGATRSLYYSLAVLFGLGFIGIIMEEMTNKIIKAINQKEIIEDTNAIAKEKGK